MKKKEIWIYLTVIMLGFSSAVIAANLAGRKNHGSDKIEANAALAAQYNTGYESKEFSIGVETDYNVATNESAFVGDVTVAHNIVIRTDQTITVKFNSASNDAITITAAESPFFMPFIEATNIFITTTAGTNNIKIILS